MSGEGILNLNELDFRNGSNNILAKLTASANTITLVGESSSNINIKGGKFIGENLTWKDSVRVSTTTAGVLASDFENGDTVDGITLATGDRILIKNQASPVENGIYEVQASGAPSRTEDCVSGAQATGTGIYVVEGSSNGNSLWFCGTTPSANFGSSITFTEFTGGGSGTPGGADTNVQFNNAGSFGGSSDFTWDGTSVKVLDGKDFTAGTGDDLVITHDGSNSSLTNSTGNVIIENTATSSNIVIKLGTATNATSFRIRDSADQDQFYVDMSGAVFTPQIRTGVTGNAVGITSGEIVDTVSLRYYKTNERLYTNSKNILKLQPKLFTWKADNTEDLGLIVEDALNIPDLHEFIYKDPKTGPKNFKDRSLIAGLIACVKEQESQINQLNRQLTEMKHQIKRLTG